MADWGPGIYENDDTMDWIYDLLDSGGISRVKRALDIIKEDGAEDVEIADCRIALAAADLVAAIDGDINPNLPAEAEEWLTLINRPVSNLRAKAEEVVRDILESSPLKVYYKTNGKYPEWKQTVESLLKRLEL
jgi:predicted alternative tryptophan synthase beta-subunit